MLIEALMVAATALAAHFTVMPASGDGRAMPLAGPTKQPIGHYEFCKRHAAECVSFPRAAPPMKLDRHDWALVNSVTREVNHRIEPESDQEAYGANEFWTYPVTVGDCEDYALLKRRILLGFGFPPSDLPLTVVRKRDGEAHAVLTLRTASGDFVLDNLDDRVLLWSSVPYDFIKRQSADDPARWVSIGEPGLEEAARRPAAPDYDAIRPTSDPR
jgi:predicted transglutaminase-like cysteine proteinase